MDRLRIALTLEQCWHRVPGGTAVAGIGMARGLSALVEVIGVAARHASPPPAGWEPPVTVKHLPLPRVALYESWHRLRWPAVQRATGPVDLIHATSIAVPPRSAPLVVTVHDLAFLHDPTHFTKRGLSFFRRGLEVAGRDADLIVCPSHATAADCVAHGLGEERIRVVPMGVGMERASEREVSAARDRYGLPERYIMWSGTIEPRKNLRRLLEAFSSLELQHDLVLVGPAGWNEDLDDMMGLARKRIKALGFVPYRDLPALYAGADAFVFPSIFEGFGLPVLEAMSQGVPVVTSAGTSTEEVGGDLAVLVDPLDTADIARGIARALDDPGVRAKAADGPARAAGFSWDATAAGLLRCYEELVP